MRQSRSQSSFLRAISSSPHIILRRAPIQILHNRHKNHSDVPISIAFPCANRKPNLPRLQSCGSISGAPIPIPCANSNPHFSRADFDRPSISLVPSSKLIPSVRTAFSCANPIPQAFVRASTQIVRASPSPAILNHTILAQQLFIIPASASPAILNRLHIPLAQPSTQTNPRVSSADLSFIQIAFHVCDSPHLSASPSNQLCHSFRTQRQKKNFSFLPR
jgi:hypothetical protein